jgi:hypothetical protein
MRAAVLRYVAGKATALPYRVTRQIVAARLGQLPSTIDRMPADDFLDAMALAPVTAMTTNIGGGDG